MLRLLRVGFAYLGMVFLAACQTIEEAPRVTAHQANQRIVTHRKTGGKFLMSAQPGSLFGVALVHDTSLKQFGTPVVVRVQNKSKSAVQFDATDVMAKSQDRQLVVLDLDGFKQAVKVKENVALVQAAVFGIAAGVGAGAYASRSGANPAVAAALAGAAVSVDSAATAAAAEAKQDGEFLVNDTRRQLLGPVSLAPDASVDGLLIIESPELAPASDTASLGADAHTFSLKR